jgi:hypothetical protein
MKKSILKSKGLSVLLVLAMIITLFSGLSITASAAAPSTAVPYAGQTTSLANDYTISTATQLAALATAVNAGTSYSGVNFWQIASIDLSVSDSYTGLTSWVGGTPWTPIGSGYGTGSTPFAGTFNGSSGGGASSYFTISNLTISTSTSITGVGLFGNATGNLANITLLSGSITVTGSGNYIGGIVGYTNGSVFNCQSGVSVTATGSSNVGGIVGAIETTSTTAVSPQLKIQYCYTAANVSGYSRVGGIVGSVYDKYAGNVGVDNNAYGSSTNTIPATGVITGSSASKVYAGGVVGYCQGWVSNSYAANITLVSTNSGHYFGGVAGILQGTGPTASIYNSYGYVSTWTGTSTSYDRPLAASVDNSNVLPINHCVAVNANGYTQPQGTGTAGWGLWTNTVVVTATDAATLNGTVPTLGAAYTTGTSFPILTWQGTGGSRIYVDPVAGTTGNTPGGTISYTDNDPSTGIFLDGTAATNGTGTKASPYNNIASALAALTTSTPTIYVRGMVTLSANTNIFSSVSGATIQRSSIYDGYLFNITGGTTTVANIIIDGNKSSFSSSPVSSLFYIDADGTLNIITGATLQNNNGSDGGAVRIMGGVVAMSGGQIIGNQAAQNGGAVSIHESGSFLLSGGTIGGTASGAGNTTLGDGAGVASYNGGNFVMSGGTITGNAASGSLNPATNPNVGGALMVGSGGFATLYGGSITGNTATNGGNGIYVAQSNSLTLAPIGTGALTFGTSDAIYLPNSAGTTAGQVSFNIGTDLSTGVSGNVPLAFQTPLQTSVVAVAGSPAMALSSATVLVSGTINFARQSLSSSNIIISSLTV